MTAALIAWGTGVFSFGKENARTGDGFNPIDATPRDSSVDPLPIPSISWWWRYDPAVTASPAQQCLLPGHLTGLGTSAAHSLLRDRGQ